MKSLNNNVNNLRSGTIPAWILEKNKFTAVKSKAVSNGFLKNTLLGISKVIQNEIFSERFAKKRGFLQQIDPRIKLLTILFFMVFCGLTRNMLTLIFLAVIAFMYVKLSGLMIKDYFKRVWLILPVIVLIVSIPAATSIFFVSKPLFYLYKDLHLKIWLITLPKEIYFSFDGFLMILKMSLRIGVSFSFGYLLVMTTRWTHLTKSLAVIKIPAMVISILNMTYRYIYVLSKLAFEMMEARFLRTVGKTNNKQNRMFIANRMSFLFVKSSFLSDEIYDAMKCRGYTGEPVCLTVFKLGQADLLWIINNSIIVLILVMGEVFF